MVIKANLGKVDPGKAKLEKTRRGGTKQRKAGGRAKSRRTRPSWVKAMAQEFIKRMFDLAYSAYKKEPRLGKRYVRLAILASKKYNVRIPSQIKRRVCKKCFALLIPGFNAKVRVSKDRVIWVCGECGYERSFGKTRTPKKGKRGKAPSEDREERGDRGSNPGDKKTSRIQGASQDKGIK